MTADPELSIVIPARNEEAVLTETIESVRRAAESTGKAWELIVVDDASTDRTAAIASERGAKVVPVELHNIGAVRNAGAKQARGQVLVFLDADTLHAVTMLRRTLSSMHPVDAMEQLTKQLGRFKTNAEFIKLISSARMD